MSFTALQSTNILNSKLSVQALGAFVILWSYRNDKKICPQLLLSFKNTPREIGKHTVYKIFDELIQNKRCLRYQIKDGNGKYSDMTYELFEDDESYNLRRKFLQETIEYISIN